MKSARVSMIFSERFAGKRDFSFSRTAVGFKRHFVCQAVQSGFFALFC